MTFEYAALEGLDDDKEKWGGKATGLSQLKKNGFSVPNGIVLSSESFKKYRSKQLCESDVEPIFAEMLRKSFSCDYSNLIFRSSANVEGSAGTGFCGIFDSCVYDCSLSIFKNIAKVWESALTPRVMVYQNKHTNFQEIVMSVLIQPLVHGTYSAVVQSRDLVNNIDTIIIEYSSNGLDTVVNGEENSYLAYINPYTKEVDYYDPDSPILSEKVVELIIHDCKKIERLFGSHVELELQLFDSSIEYIQIREVG